MPKRRALRAALALTAILYAVPLQHEAPDRATSNEGAISPTFEIRLRYGRIFVSGHAASARHETRVRDAISSFHGGLEAAFDLRPLGMVPDWWESVTIAYAGALAGAYSANLRLREQRLTIEALFPDDASAARLAGLAANLPKSVQYRPSLATAAAALSVRELCERQFESFRHAPVRFEESGTAMRASAYPVLDRIVALAEACRDAEVIVTGHSDASGNEELNRRLSLGRARAVATHLQQRGIAGDRLVTAGAGSARPVANNETRYGRSLNRRIEIRFAYPAD